MDCDGSTTDDDATEDEEEKMPVDVTSESNGNDEKIKAKWYGIHVVLIVLQYSGFSKSKNRFLEKLLYVTLHILIRCQSPSLIETLPTGDIPCRVM